MAQLEELVISAIEEDVLAPDIVEASIARAVEILTEADVSNGDADRVAREMATIDRELERLALAAAGGSDIPTVLVTNGDEY